MQVLTIRVCDSHITGRPDVGYVKLPLTRMPQDGCMTAWLPVQVCMHLQKTKVSPRHLKPPEKTDLTQRAFRTRNAQAESLAGVCTLLDDLRRCLRMAHWYCCGSLKSCLLICPVLCAYSPACQASAARATCTCSSSTSPTRTMRSRATPTESARVSWWRPRRLPSQT